MKRLTYEEVVVFDRRCYGYGRDEEGFIFVKDDEAAVVKLIYNIYVVCKLCGCQLVTIS